jgi:predicted transcriptional regulator
MIQKIYFIFVNHTYKMATFTSTLPDNLLQQLTEKANALSLPKNKLIETALRLYLQHLEKAEYIKSYRQASEDKDILLVAEEGMEDYFRQLEK